LVLAVALGLSLGGCGCIYQMWQGISGAPQPPAAVPSAMLQPVFFDTGKYDIRSDARTTLKTNAAWFKQNPGKKVALECYADERGTNAANLILGQKRCEAVKNYLVKMGVDGNLLSMTDYGEDKQFCKEKTESCYQQNRRVDFKP